MTEVQPSHSSNARGDGVTLRLLWPQWQGAGTSSVQALAPEFPFEVARRGDAVGSAVLAAVLPANQGPTAAAPVAMDDTGLELASLRSAGWRYSCWAVSGSLDRTRTGRFLV